MTCLHPLPICHPEPNSGIATYVVVSVFRNTLHLPHQRAYIFTEESIVKTRQASRNHFNSPTFMLGSAPRCVSPLAVASCTDPAGAVYNYGNPRIPTDEPPPFPVSLRAHSERQIEIYRFASSSSLAAAAFHEEEADPRLAVSFDRSQTTHRNGHFHRARLYIRAPAFTALPPLPRLASHSPPLPLSGSATRFVVPRAAVCLECDLLARTGLSFF